MLMSEFLLTRKSVRTFKNKALKKDVIQSVLALIEKEGKKEEGLSFKLYTEGDKIHSALDGKAGYKGVMIESPAYITMELENEDEKAFVRGAYRLERIITNLKDLGLASCWVTLLGASDDDIREAFSSDKIIKFALAVGYMPRELSFGEVSFSSRLGVNEFVFDSEMNRPFEDDALENLGFDDLFYYLRNAPSSYNKQPWRFIVKKDKIELYLSGEVDINSYVDAGIIMYYYDSLAKTINLAGAWEIDIRKDGDFVHIADTKY